MNTQQVIQTRTERIWLREDGILQAVTLPQAEMNLDDAKENVAVFAQLALGKKRPGLIDVADVKYLSQEARAYYAGQENAKVMTAVALVVGSPISRIIGNFFVGLNKTPFPTRLFTDEEKALQWLTGYLT